MAAYDHLPLFKAMMEVTVLVENTVKFFSRYHKYTLGSELRTMCHDALGLVMEANSLVTRGRRFCDYGYCWKGSRFTW